MKPSEIYKALDLARVARQKNFKYNVCLVGAPGIAKSEIVQDWASKHSLKLIDLRGAYLEAPDLIGFPSITLADGRHITTHNIPEFWPTEGAGVLFIDEINRSTTAVMNCFMQLLTDRKVHQYELPKSWLIVAAINPENGAHDVNTMDAALKDRFVMYNVEYDRVGHIDYMKKTNHHKDVIAWVEAGVFKYVLPENVGEAIGNKYVSPRTISMLSAAIQSGESEYSSWDSSLEFETYEAILGRNHALSFIAFRKDDVPVSYNDLITDWKRAKKRLEKFANPNDYKSAHISITIRDIVDNFKEDDEKMTLKQLGEIVLALPADFSIKLMSDLDLKLSKSREENGTFWEKLVTTMPKLKDHLRDNLKAK